MSSPFTDILNDLVKVASGIVVAPHYTVDYADQAIKAIIAEAIGQPEELHDQFCSGTGDYCDCRTGAVNQLRAEIRAKLGIEESKTS